MEIGSPVRAGGEVRAFVRVVEPRRSLASIVDRYDKLGADRVFLLVDETHLPAALDLARSRSNVHVAVERGGDRHVAQLALRRLLDRYARRCWSVVLDSNEQLRYPSVASEPLQAFCRQLEQRGWSAVAGPIVDTPCAARDAASRDTTPGASPAPGTIAIDTVASDPVTGRIFPARLLLDAEQNEVGETTRCRSKIALIKLDDGVCVADGFRAIFGARSNDISPQSDDAQDPCRISIVRETPGSRPPGAT